MQKKVDETAERYSKKIEAIYEKYREEQLAIEQKKAQLNEELRKAETRQQEIIEEYKRAEQIRQDKDYYRIVLSESAVSDVKKLRKVADELHSPTILYKLIYKEYYERPFNEMVGRVVKNDAGSSAGVGIYKITNLVNGRVYIGQTRQAFKERWRTHVKRGVKAEPGTTNKLYNAMWEEGVENFSFEVLAQCSAAELNEKEKEYIALFHADTWGYNSTSGGS